MRTAVSCQLRVRTAASSPGPTSAAAGSTTARTDLSTPNSPTSSTVGASPPTLGVHTFVTAPFKQAGTDRIRAAPGSAQPPPVALSTMTTLRSLSLFVAGSSAVWALAACSLPPVEAKPADRANTPQCKAASSAWPAKVAGFEPYPVTTPSDAVRAWGERPESSVIARCGLTPPGPTTETCFEANGVDWVQSDLSDGRRYTTYGREPAIEVLVPKESKADASTLAAFAPAAKKIAQGERRCS